MLAQSQAAASQLIVLHSEARLRSWLRAPLSRGPALLCCQGKIPPQNSADCDWLAPFSIDPPLLLPPFLPPTPATSPSIPLMPPPLLPLPLKPSFTRSFFHTLISPFSSALSLSFLLPLKPSCFARSFFHTLKSPFSLPCFPSLSLVLPLPYFLPQSVVQYGL